MFNKRPLQSSPIACLDLNDHGRILSVTFSPYEWSQNVLLVACKNTIIVIHVKFTEEIEFEKLADLSHNSSCTSIALSPMANINLLPINMQFCTASNDHKLRLYRGDLDRLNEIKELGEHNSFINDISYSPDGNYLASVSDDLTAKIWDLDDLEVVGKLILTSPGVAICWHRENTKKLMVAEKIGVIRLYNVDTMRPVMSFMNEKMLFSAHWSPSDIRIFASLQMGELFLWDISRPSCPVMQNMICTEMGGEVKISPLGELVAMVNPLEGELKVVHCQSKQERMVVKVSSCTNLSWHFKHPLICLGENNFLCLWKVISK